MQASLTGLDEDGHDSDWNAGDLGCGELILMLRKRLRAMPGLTLKLTACDPGAIADIPSYCRMTGHTLLRSIPEEGIFWIRAKY
jgi:tRNA 2-thiouridine synthesizing protein A